MNWNEQWICSNSETCYNTDCAGCNNAPVFYTLQECEYYIIDSHIFTEGVYNIQAQQVKSTQLLYNSIWHTDKGTAIAEYLRRNIAAIKNNPRILDKVIFNIQWDINALEADHE
jgi:hypothetical protein